MSGAQWVEDHSVPVTILRFIKGDGLRIEFQPIVDLSSGRIVGVEALARFATDPSVGPDRWFERADELGLRTDLESSAIDAAIDQLSKVPSDAYITLNCSPGVATSGVLDKLLAGLPLERVVVEITEGEQIQDYLTLNEALAQLRARGLRVAIDDAGAGFAGIAHLIELRPDIIKLDIELTRNVDVDPHRKALIRSLTEYAAAVGASIIAEGIETKDELRALQRLGVHFGQGYYLGRPGPLQPSNRGRIRVPARPLARARRHRALGRVIAALAAAAVIAVPTAALANGSMPGTSLYPVKLRIESIRIALAGGPAGRARLHAEFAHRRAAELAYLLSTGDRIDHASAVLANLRANAEAALEDGGKAKGVELESVRAAVERDLLSANYSLSHACSGRSASCAPAKKSIDDLIIMAAPPATHPHIGPAKGTSPEATGSKHTAQPASGKAPVSIKPHPAAGLTKTLPSNSGGKTNPSNPHH